MNRGRKSKYETHVKPHLKAIAAMCRDGMVEKDIAKALGIAMSSFSKYKIDFPEFSETVSTAKIIADYHVKNALYERAVGVEYDEVKSVYIENENQQRAEKKTGNRSTAGKCKRVTRTSKKVLGSVQAQQLWMLNRGLLKSKHQDETETPQISEDEELQQARQIIDSMTATEKEKRLRELLCE